MKKERKRRRQSERRPLAGGPAAGSPVTAAGASSPGRKWLVRLLAIFVPIFIVFGGSELVLRSFGFGYDPHFFKREMVGGRACYVANDNFGLRFFPHGMVRLPSPVVMPVTKVPGTFRIFIFGESAALGDPRPNYGAGCYLDVLLRERFPLAKFEIVNTSITAINSHTILPIARECARHQGDLWLIYMGNNEMVGPFGAVTVFGAKAPPLWLVRTQLQLRRLRLWQELIELAQKIQKGDHATEDWGGMAMFARNQVAPDAPSRQRVYRSFARNLDDILKAGLNSGAKIVLSTVAVNLKDCSPFGSLSGADLVPADGAAFTKACQDGTTAEAQGHFADAKSDFYQATEILPQAAEAQFQLATCLLRLTNAAEALRHFQQAVDDDTLPFRADSHINGTIRAAARSFAGSSLVLCDAANILGAASPDGVPGENFFYEHVHLNPDGNYALAIAWADQVEHLLPPALKLDARPSWASQAECEARLGLTDWNRISILEEILRRVQHPPFSGRSGNAQQVAHLQDELAGLRQRLTDKAAVQAQQVYLSALRREPENFRLHENYAEFLEARLDWKAAIVERNKVCKLTPQYYFPYYVLGVDLKEAGELAEACEAQLKAKALKPDEGDVRVELGVIYGRQNDWDQACKELDAARRFSPDDPRAALFLGEVLWELGRRDEALATLHDAIRLDPSDWQPHYRLASDLARQGRFSDAAVEYQEALRLNPDNVKTKLDLAAILLDLGREPEALQQLNDVLKLDPGNHTALEFLQKMRGL